MPPLRIVVGTGAVRKITFWELNEDTAIPSGVQAAETAITIPAGAVVLSVTTRVLVQPGGTATMSVRGASTDHQFNEDDIETDADTTDLGTAGCPFFDGPGEAIRYVFDTPTTDALGSIRSAVIYYAITPPSA